MKNLSDLYALLGVSEYATDRELSEAYFSLRKKYQEERFSDGDKGNEAAKKLTEIDNAYDEIKRYRNEHPDSDNAGLFKQVDEALKKDDLQTAQSLLDSFDERSAEWHFLQSVVFYKKNWINECKNQLEIAMNLDSSNQKYKDTYQRLLNKIKQGSSTAKDEGWNKSGSGSGASRSRSADYDEPQMGGDSCAEFCCQLVACNACLNCCCSR